MKKWTNAKVIEMCISETSHPGPAGHGPAGPGAPGPGPAGPGPATPGPGPAGPSCNSCAGPYSPLISSIPILASLSALLFISVTCNKSA